MDHGCRAAPLRLLLSRGQTFCQTLPEHSSRDEALRQCLNKPQGTSFDEAPPQVAARQLAAGRADNLWVGWPWHTGCGSLRFSTSPAFCRSMNR